MNDEGAVISPDANRGGESGSARSANDTGHAPRSLLGIKAKLFLAFCLMAGLTATASAVAWYVFGDIGRAVTGVTQQSLPSMESALNLARKSSEIVAAAPALMASRNQAERAVEQTRLARRTEALVALIEELRARRLAPDATSRLIELQGELTTKLEELNAAIERRLRLKAHREESLAKLAAVHIRFLEAAEPLVDDSVFNLVIRGEQVTAESKNAITELVDGGVGRIDRLLTINAELNLAAGLLAEANHVGNPVLIQPIRERFVAAAAAVERSLRHLPDEPRTTALRRGVGSVFAFGQGARGVFGLGTRAGRRTGPARSDAERSQISAALKAAHERLLLLLTPMIDDAAFDLVLATEGVTAKSTAAITNLIDVGAQLLHLLLSLRAEVNLASDLLNQAAAAPEAGQLRPLRERFIAAEGQIARMFKGLPPSVDVSRLRTTSRALLDLGKASDGLFALRREELRQMAHAQSALEAGRTLTVRLGAGVEELVRAARKQSQAAVSRSAEAIAGGKLLMVIITAVGIVGAAIVMLYYVGQRIIQPLRNITAAMTDLATGDTSVEIPGRDRGDELGRMAQALGVFRDTAVEMQESNLKEIRETRRRLSDAIESISEGFSLYDSEDRLVICNDKYRRLLYPGLADEILPGMSFEEIVRRAAERGLVKDARDDPEAWVAARLARHRNPSGPHIQQRGDNRWILVSERKTEEGGTVAVYSDITELKQREQELAEKSSALEHLSNQLAKYLSPQVYESIFTGRQEVKIASQRKKLTVFFSDIAGFTETADRLESEELTQLLNHYLTEMSRIALDHGATIDKYVGDAIVIFFGDPESKGVKQDALACVNMAIAMRERMLDLQTVWRDSGIEKPLKCRMGINTGYCTVGNFGSEDRMDYTIIGGGVNLASRLESAATPGEILVSYETQALVNDEIECVDLGNVAVKGIAYPVATYQVVDSQKSRDRRSRQIREDHPNLKLNLDLDAMSAEQRVHATEVLQKALLRVSDPD